MLHHFAPDNDIVLDIITAMLNYRDKSMKTNTNVPPLESMLSKSWFQIAVPCDMSLINRYKTNMLISKVTESAQFGCSYMTESIYVQSEKIQWKYISVA